MKPKTLVLMGAAIVCGLLASYFTSRALEERNARVAVLVARQPCPQWTPIDDPDKLFEAVELPRSLAPPGHVPADKAVELESRVFSKQVNAGQTVTWDDLQDRAKLSIEGRLPRGKRAFAIEASARTAAGGFVLPGTRVDVIQVRRDGGNVRSRYVLEDLLVRGVDQQAERPQEKGLVPSTITLEVSPEEVLKLSEAAASGTLALSLRGLNDTSRAQSPPVPLPPEIPEARTIQAGPDLELPRFFQTGYDGQSWRRVEYTLDKEGRVLRSRAVDPENP